MRAKISIDRNGNKIVKITATMPLKNFRGFSVQTNGNLPKCHELEAGETWDLSSRIEHWEEMKSFLTRHGTAKQRQAFGSGMLIYT